jgi:hypothetical protein
MSKYQQHNDDFEIEANPAQTRKLLATCFGAVFAVCIGFGGLVYLTLNSSSDSAPTRRVSSDAPSAFGRVLSWSSGEKTSAREFDASRREVCGQLSGAMDSAEESSQVVMLRRLQGICRGN